MGNVFHLTGKSKKILIHLHMPKTGGSTLKKIIKKNYDNRSSFEVYCEQRKLSEKLTELSKLNVHCIQGHFPYGIHKYFSKPYAYVTMLREPIDRVISEYFYIRNIPWNENHEKVMKMSLEEYQNEQINQNLQTRYILGTNFNKPLTDEDFEQAKLNLLNDFSLVGITEYFDQSVFMMQKQFEWDNIYYSKVNVTKSRLSKREVSPVLLEKIMENNQYDIQLYSLAKALFEKRLQSLDIKSKKELKRYIRTNQQYKNRNV
jgi:hypothetical protein